MSEGIRIDKWLWAVRIFKTRNLATESCKKGRVLIHGEAVKPSRSVHVSDIIEIRKLPLTLTYQVTGLIEKRVSAKTAAEHVKNLTPPEEIDRLRKMQESAFYSRDRGTGRPTKKDRRLLDNFDF